MAQLIPFILIKLLFQFTIMPHVMKLMAVLAIFSSVFGRAMEKIHVRVILVHHCEIFSANFMTNYLSFLTNFSVRDVDGIRLQIGVVSFGALTCGDGSGPSVNSRIEYLPIRNWIQSVSGL
jgi:hypothetical protein